MRQIFSLANFFCTKWVNSLASLIISLIYCCDLHFPSYAVSATTFRRMLWVLFLNKQASYPGHLCLFACLHFSLFSLWHLVNTLSRFCPICVRNVVSACLLDRTVFYSSSCYLSSLLLFPVFGGFLWSCISFWDSSILWSTHPVP